MTLNATPENALHPLITPGRDTGNGYAISCRYYPCDEVEVTAIQLGYEDSLKRGGGAKRKTDSKESMDAPTLAKSCARARTTVRRKALSMQADRMLTLTFKDNLEDIDVAWIALSIFQSCVVFAGVSAGYISLFLSIKSAGCAFSLGHSWLLPHKYNSSFVEEGSGHVWR
ncbi:hypothetical protein CBP51_18555 [Cellvibrio mixtus]|uniref:Uncharacterized protein n=1 Tax=Cellvibrio mixtus TaxID=39650 RepID=A0A266Q5H7_9GAMM|nr:hypothetical protein [Cellvibrio mixtus]OZY85134.1 hypothetical protein CBP51_18555 [Cellvibrio mixtus]